MGIASDFVLVVLAALAGALVARALRLPLLVGYVAAGVMIGPHTAGPTVVQIHDIEVLAEIGVALLLFSLGLEVSPTDLKPVRKVALAGGAIQIVVTALAAAIPAAWLLGLGRTEAVWFGVMISLSSTMVVLKTLEARGYLHTLASRVMIGILIAQDLAVVPILVVLPQLGKPVSGLSVLLPVVSSVAVLGVLAAVAMWVLPRLLKRILEWGSRELFLVAVVAIGVGAGAVTHAFGMSFALGAFVAGLMLSQSDVSRQALSDIEPVRDIFGLLFFVSVGMLFDPGFAIENAGRVAIMVCAVVLGKALILAPLTRAFGYKYFAPYIIGLGLAQIGEFSFVLARSGLGLGALSPSTYNLILTTTILTMAISPLVSLAALPLGRKVQLLDRHS
jgi:CPA2 family monovalent cation:H+ antiporter-2